MWRHTGAESPARFLASIGMSAEAANEIATYLDESLLALGELPTQETLIAERFFDESGGMQLVIHAPFGSRINKAWGLALRKRFCRQFNFELQAAATEDAVLLSLGPQHSFPLADVFRYLHPNTARDVLVQAFLDAPVFQTRWRWNTTISLAIPRNRSGRKVPPQLQRAMADDLMAAVFPDAAACFENIQGDRELPDHPLVNQVVRDCLEEAMDFEGLARVLTRIHSGEIRCIARDTTEPSPLSHEILNAKPYAFLDDAPLEERRTQAVMTRRSGADEFGMLDANAIERVRDEVRPDPRDPDELHDALLTFGFLLDGEVDEARLTGGGRLAAGGDQERDGCEQPAVDGEEEKSASQLFAALVASRRAGRIGNRWIAAERLPELQAIHPAPVEFKAPPSRQREWSREDAIVELIRGRMNLVGPTTAQSLALSLSIDEAEADGALVKLESEGAVLRGHFERLPVTGCQLPTGNRQPATGNQWCDRRLLARIHRYTLNRLRAEIEPVGAAGFMRFLFAWQHVSMPLRGVDGLRAVLAQLDGYEVAANAWERSVLPSRISDYDPSMLDTLTFGGEAGWARLSASDTLPVAATPIALYLRDHSDAWQALRAEKDLSLSDAAQRTLDQLRTRGPSFVRDLDNDDEALAELVSAGLVTCDGFSGLRALIGTSRDKRLSGRWAIIGGNGSADDAIETQARVLLQRYGVVFRRLLTREANAAPWRELARVYRRLEARGEIRGGRFVSGMSGEQFALGAAVDRLREIRRETPDDRLVVISAADPLNLAGVLTTGDRVRATSANRIAYRNGIPVSALEGEYLRPLTETDETSAMQAAAALAGRAVNVTRGFVGRA